MTINTTMVLERIHVLFYGTQKAAACVSYWRGPNPTRVWPHIMIAQQGRGTEGRLLWYNLITRSGSHVENDKTFWSTLTNALRSPLITICPQCYFTATPSAPVAPLPTWLPSSNCLWPYSLATTPILCASTSTLLRPASTFFFFFNFSSCW